jgi:GNAT superfamily N-acetyltransferase
VTSSVTLNVREETSAALGDYASISIAFEVRTILAVDVKGDGSNGFHLTERSIEQPYVKRYDDDREEHPTAWPRRFDVSRWGILSAYRDGERVGGAVVARDTDSVRLLDGRRDLALLWDIRVATTARGQGIGSALFRAAEAWSIRHGCSTLAVETQNVNVPACRFYAAQGCVLGAINRFAYAKLPDEVQLLWYKRLVP